MGNVCYNNGKYYVWNGSRNVEFSSWIAAESYAAKLRR